MSTDGGGAGDAPGCSRLGGRHALYCVGAEPLVFLFTFARDRFEEVVYHFDAA